MDAIPEKPRTGKPPKAARRVRDFKKIFEHRFPPHGYLPPTDLGRRFALLYVDHQILLENGAAKAKNFLARRCSWMTEHEREEVVRAASALAPQVPSDERAALELDLSYSERASIRWQEQRTLDDGTTKWVWQSIGSVAATDADMAECKHRTNERRVAKQAAQRKLNREQRTTAMAAAAADARLKGGVLAVYEATGSNWISVRGLAAKLRRRFGKAMAKRSVERQVNRHCVSLIGVGLIEERTVPGPNNLKAREVRRPR
jgi:hypothetical protein